MMVGKNILCTCFQKLCSMFTLIMFGMIYFCIHAGQFYQCLVWLNGRKSAFYFTSVKRSSVKRRVRFGLNYIVYSSALSPVSGTSIFIFLLYSPSTASSRKSLLIQVCSSNAFGLFSKLFRIFSTYNRNISCSPYGSCHNHSPHFSTQCSVLASNTFTIETAPFMLTILYPATIGLAPCTAPKTTFL